MANTIQYYFLGENTPNGFKTYFSSEILKKDYYTYILKGGPGTGKSTLMKKILSAFKDSEDIDVYRCSSDINSLDALVLKTSKVIIVDGTAPHVFDCQYPGAFQSIVALGDCWNKNELQENKYKIKSMIDENQQFHNRSRRYISALASINSDIYSIASSALNLPKLSAFTQRFCKKFIPKKSSEPGYISFKKISAISNFGYFIMSVENYQNVFILNDSYFAGSDSFLSQLSDIVTSKGYDIILSECSIFNQSILEHLLIPELSIAFISSNYITKYENENAKKINFLRFYNMNNISEKKQRLEFSKKAGTELLNEAVGSIQSAKKVHDEIEDFYINNMNFSLIDEITLNIIDEIKRISTNSL